MKVLSLALIPILFAVSGCSIINMASGPGSYYRHYAADNGKRSIDGSIQDELRKAPPGGYLTKPYSRSLWDRYWNDVLSGYLNEERHPQYRGPSGDQFAAYIIRERQAAGLPPIRLTPENRKRMRAAGIPLGG